MNQTRVPSPQLRESLFSHSLGQKGLGATQAGVCWPQRPTDWCPLQSPESGLLLIHFNPYAVWTGTRSRLYTTCFPAPPKIGGRDAHSTKPRTDPWSAERDMAVVVFALSSRPFFLYCVYCVVSVALFTRTRTTTADGHTGRRAGPSSLPPPPRLVPTPSCLACRRNRI